MPYRPPRSRLSPPPHPRRHSDDRAAPASRRTSYNDPDAKDSTSWAEQDSWGSWTGDSGWGEAWGQSTSKAQSNINQSSDNLNDSGWGEAWGQSTSKAQSNINQSSDNLNDSGWGQAWGQNTSKAQSNINQSSDNLNDSGWGQAWGQNTSKAQSNTNQSSDYDSGWGQAWGQTTTKPQTPPSSVNRALTNSPSVLHASPAMSRLRPHDHERELHKTDVNQAPTPKETKRPVLNTKLQQRSLDFKPSSPIVPMHLIGLLPRRGDEISSPQIPTASQTPKELHANLIKELVDVVIIRYKLLKAEDKKMKWRGARQSSCYYHSAPAAREILDRTYQEFIETIGILTKQLNSSLKKVVQYSDALNTHKEKVTKSPNSQNIMSYTCDLRDWIVNVDLQRRLSNTKAFIKRKEEENAVAKRRRQEEMDNLRNAMAEQELKAADIWDDFCRLDTSLPERFNEEFTAAKNAMKKDDIDPNLNQEMLANMGIGGEDIKIVRTKGEMIDRTVDNFTIKSQELQVRIKSLEDQVADLRQRDSDINEFRRDAHVRLRQMDAWRLEDMQKMDQISLMVENLNMAPRSAPSAPANAVDLVPCINELVTQYIAEEVKPALDAIAEACEKGNQRARAELDKLLEQIVTKTYDLVQMALQANGLFPQIVPHSQ